MSLYTEKQYVDAVVIETGEEVQIPKAWIGTEYASGYDVDGKVDSPVEIPDGDPVEGWTAKQLDAYAEREGIDLGGATKKGDKLDAITAAKTVVTGD